MALDSDKAAASGDLRVASFNASLNRAEAGALASDLDGGEDAQARAVAEIIQKTDADVILINEFDYDASGNAAELFRSDYLAVGQNGATPIHYPHLYVAPSNTGIPTGFDLDNSGGVGDFAPNDAQGFGFFEGQFGFVIFSKHEIDRDNIRSFQEFLWQDMPGALLPDDPEDADGNGDISRWYSADELDVLRLSSKNHVDVPVIVDGQTVHILAAHPTPPVFDGPEDRNGTRNHDEIRFWADYVAGEDYMYDDNGVTGGLAADARFVIVGDYNADPFDGDSVSGAIQQLLDAPEIIGSATDPAITPAGPGGAEQAVAQGGANAEHSGNPAFDTADFGFNAGDPSSDNAPGNLRVDYVLPSQQGFDYVGGGVVWPSSDDPDFALTSFPTSDHRLVFADLAFTDTDAPEEEDVFTLELFHIGDQEASASAIKNAPNLSAVFAALRGEDLGDDGAPDNTLFLSSGDAIIPGVFFDASEEVFGSAGIADIQIQNELGIQAMALGNHEFDKGTGALAGLIDGSAPGDFSALEGSSLEGQDFAGADFPYLSANLGFDSDGALAPLEIEGGQAPQGNVVTSSTVITMPAQQEPTPLISSLLEEEAPIFPGEQIGVVGATTPTLASISSSGDVTIQTPPFGQLSDEAEIDALAADIQAEVDALLEQNPAMNKVVLLSHMQRIDVEQALAERLTDVDIIVAGGSNTRLTDSDDILREGDGSQGTYPIFVDDADGNPTAIVNTDGSYKYLGRLVIDFDENGVIIPESYDDAVSGAYATDDAMVERLGAEDLVDPEIQAIVDAIEEEIIATEGNVFGLSSVFLNGNRSGSGEPGDPDGVRTQETNLGNLTADANLVEAQKTDPDVVISLKNGGGIRASIGETVVPAGETSFVRKANGELTDADGNVVKPEGGISQNDIQKVLAFNNDLVILTLTRAEIVDLLEHGVGAVPGVSGRFPQVSGVNFSFDPANEPGERIVNAGIFDEEGGLIAELARDGAVVGDPAETFKVVTLGFLAAPRFDDDGTFTGGGDGYPFPNSNTDPEVGAVGPDAARINPVFLEQEDVQTGQATFADDGTEQDALAEYLAANFTEDAFDFGETAPTDDARIQNLGFREDAVFADVPEPEPEPDLNLVEGDQGGDRLFGSREDDEIRGNAGSDRMEGGGGADQFVFGDEAFNGRIERDQILDFELGVDTLVFEDGVTVEAVSQTSRAIVLDLSGDGDMVFIRGVGVTAENILENAVFDDILNVT